MISLSLGDRLLFLKNDTRLGVNNGRFAHVVVLDLNAAGKVKNLVCELDGTQTRVLIDPMLYGDFMHGYAATVHKTQGMTVKHAFVYIWGKSWDRHLTYVAISRHKASCQLYADRTTYPGFNQLAISFGRDGLKDSVLDYPYAFAKRRNIRPNEGGFLKHLTSRLKKFKDEMAQKLRALS